MSDSLSSMLQNHIVREVVAGLVYPACAGAAWWAWAKLRQLGAIHKAIMPNGGGSLLDRVGAIEDDLVVLRDGQRARDDANGSGEVHTFECQSDGICLYASRSLAGLFGLSQEEMRGYGWLDAIDGASERQRVQANWMAALANGSPYRDTYRVHNRRTGERFIATAHATVSRNRNGKVLRIFGTVERVSRIREATDYTMDFPTEHAKHGAQA